MAITDISSVEFAALATDAYRDKPKGTRVFRWTRQNFFGDPTNGFFAVAYHAIRSKQLVIAYRGSGGDSGDWSMSGNLGNALGIKLWDSQLNTAMAYFDACRGIYSPDSIAVCGHSLGGLLAAMVACKSHPAAATQPGLAGRHQPRHTVCRLHCNRGQPRAERARRRGTDGQHPGRQQQPRRIQNARGPTHHPSAGVTQ